MPNEVTMVGPPTTKAGSFKTTNEIVRLFSFTGDFQRAPSPSTHACWEVSPMILKAPGASNTGGPVCQRSTGAVAISLPTTYP